MRAAGLDDVVELLGLGRERRLERLERGEQAVGRLVERGEVDGDGNTSLDDWPMLTWSLGCTPSPARVASTSLAFMFDDVPEPVWKTSIGNWSSCSPGAISSAAAPMRLGELAVEQAEVGVDARRGALDAAEPAHEASGTRSPETGKFATAFLSRRPTAAAPFSR